jgi:cell division protein FtsW
MTKPVKIYFSIFFLLVIFGTVMVFNIRVFNVPSVNESVVPILRSLIINLGLALSALTLSYIVNIDAVRSWIKYALVFTILILIATYLIGTEVNGSKRWINLGFMMIQPSEFAKIIVIFYMAEVICNKRERIGLLKELIYPFCVVLIVVALIAFEDLGTGLIIFSVAVFQLLMGGMRFKYIVVLGILATIGFVILIAMRPYRLERIKTFRDPWQHRFSSGFQQVQSEIALGRGGVTGVGFGNSQKKMKYVPEAHTDFIYSIIGEEFGFVGSLILISLFATMFGIGSYFALTVYSRFGFYLISGFVTMIAVQTIINLGVVTSSLPNKGVPLPFISYGGSALMSYSIMIGFILNAVTSDNRYSNF